MLRHYATEPSGGGGNTNATEPSGGGGNTNATEPSGGGGNTNATEPSGGLPGISNAGGVCLFSPAFANARVITVPSKGKSNFFILLD
jgi:hypothetical protein